MTHALVLGRGLIGSALENALAEVDVKVHADYPALSWNNPGVLEAEFVKLFEAFAKKLTSDDTWMIAWTAGKAVMSSPQEVLDTDNQLLSVFLKTLEQSALTQPGILFLASSAGAIYADEKDLCTEESSAHPSSLYGQNKIKQEELLTAWAADQSHIRLLIGRIATVFGPNQNERKSQGLISHISRSIIHRAPINIFVPLDTVRDYVYSDDCAAHIALCLKKMMEEKTEKIVMKIFASERVTTVAQIIGVFRRISAQPPQIVASNHVSGALYSHYTRFRSLRWPKVRPKNEHSLVSAIATVHKAELLRHQRAN